MGIAKLLTDRVSGFWSDEYNIKDFSLSTIVDNIYTFRLNAETFSMDISYNKDTKVITNYSVVDGSFRVNEGLLLVNLTDLISQGIMNAEVSDTVFSHIEFVNASISQYLDIVNTASELRDDLDNKNTTLLSTIETAVDQTETIQEITNSISSDSIDTIALNIQSIIDTAHIQGATVLYVDVEDENSGYVDWNKTTNVVTFGIPKGANGVNGNNGLTPNYEFTYNDSTGDLEYNLIGYTNENLTIVEEW